MRRFVLISCVLGAVLALRPGLGSAQDVGPALDYVGWSTEILPARIAPGDHFNVVVDAEIADGWKMYAMDSPRPSIAVSFEWPDPPSGLMRAGDVRQSPPSEAHDPWFDMDVRYFTGEARFTAPFRVLEEAEAGARTLEGSATFQICSENLCLPPTPVALAADVEIVGREAVEGTRQVPDLTSSAGESVRESEGSGRSILEGEGVGPVDLDDATAGGLWGFLALAVGAGLAALLTPCVFPMIPLTVSYFTKHSADRAESVRMALVYGGAIVLTFTSLGVAAALLVGASGAQTVAANPWINLSIGVLFVVFALSLLGLFELRLPNGLLNYFNRQSTTRSGYLGVGFMGLTLTLVSFSCTAPFVGGLLAATANDDWAYPIAGMAVFSATFSLPFVLFALFPRALTSLPRSGAWMNTVKVMLGFVELAAALKFLSNADLIWGWGLISRPLAVALSVVIFGVAGFYLLGKIRLRGEPPVDTVGVARLMTALAVFGLALYMLPGLFGAPLNALDAYLPPRQATDVSLLPAFSGGDPAGESNLTWFEDRTEAFAQARSLDKPVFIDFTGHTCTNCREMEANVFPRREVASRLERDFVLLRLFTDDRDTGPDLQRYQLMLTGTVALPTYAVVDASTQELLSRRTGMASAAEFAAFLGRGAAAYRSEGRAVP